MYGFADSPSRRWVFWMTLLLGLLATVAVAYGLPPAERTFAAVSGPAQSLMSVVTPLLGISLTNPLRVSPQPRLAPALTAAAIWAAVIAALGVVMAALIIPIAGSTAPDPWQGALSVALGSLLVQLVAQFVGTGLGLLLRSMLLAFALSIAVPLGLWLLFGLTPALDPARAWLTPFAAANNQLSGHMTGLAWAQWVVIVLLWPVALNALGWRLRPRPTE